MASILTGEVLTCTSLGRGIASGGDATGTSGLDDARTSFHRPNSGRRRRTSDLPSGPGRPQAFLRHRSDSGRPQAPLQDPEVGLRAVQAAAVGVARAVRDPSRPGGQGRPSDGGAAGPGHGRVGGSPRGPADPSSRATGGPGRDRHGRVAARRGADGAPLRERVLRPGRGLRPGPGPAAPDRRPGQRQVSERAALGPQAPAASSAWPTISMAWSASAAVVTRGGMMRTTWPKLPAESTIRCRARASAMTRLARAGSGTRPSP